MQRDDPALRRSVVPPAAGRSLWLAAAWTGAGAAVVGAIVAITVVAICWLPAANGAGSAGSAIRAGIITFLAALHGGVTVDGLPATFVPLGMTVLVGAIAWRAGAGLGDVAAALGERRPGVLLRAAALQVVVFATVSGAAAHAATLGSSGVSALAAVLAGAALFAVTGGVAFSVATGLVDAARAELPGWLMSAARAAAAAILTYLAAGALLVAAALVVHHHRVEALSGQLGGGWSGVPILLLGVLAAPNAAIAGAAYLTGPGFALGSAISLGTAAHGTLPAFPLLGAVPSGPASWPVWVLVAATPLAAGGCTAHIAARGAGGLLPRLRIVAGAGVFVAIAGAVLAWQGGGAVGSGRLSTIGASPWQFGLASGAAVAVIAAAILAVHSVPVRWAWWAERRTRIGGGDAPTVRERVLAAVRPAQDGTSATDDPGDAEEDWLAG